jgi:tetratricopeptide (TPR) repeat protein
VYRLTARRLFAEGSAAVMFVLVLLLFGSESRAERALIHVDEGRIETLVRQLGSQQFSQRARARDELQRIGAPAFDALFAALEDDDVEIRLQARSLIRSIEVPWLEPSDSQSVKSILDIYRRQDNSGSRAESLQRLAKLPNDEGLAALCRVVRFEVSEHLSKRAAMLVMLSNVPKSGPAVEARRDVIDANLSTSRRTAARWLKSYRDFLENPASTLEDWQGFKRHEEEVLRKRPSRIQRDLVRDFLQWQIRVLDSVGRRAEAIAVINESSLLDVSDAAELGETLEWLIKHKAWRELDQVARKHQPLIESDPYALYLWARSHLERDQGDRAAELAEKAFLMTPDDSPEKRLELAERLLQGFMRDWAEREYRQVIDKADVDSDESRVARFSLALHKHHWGQNKAAADLLEPLISSIKKDRNRRGQWESTRVQGIYHFALGLHYQESGDTTRAMENLKKALSADPTNVDALIAMYRLDGIDESSKASVRKQIEEQIQQFDVGVKAIEQQYQRQPSPELLEALGIMLNQYAWMVGNTFGDYQLALARSTRSLEIKPDYAGYLDTLARCYYAIDDYENAVLHQRRAAELEPHEGQIVRQLEFFEKEYAARQKATADTNNEK